MRDLATHAFRLMERSPMFHGQLDKAEEQLGDSQIDLFLCSASFEARCCSLPMSIAKLAPTKSIVAFNENILPLVAENRDRLLTMLGPSSEQLPLNGVHPLVSADNIFTSIGQALEHAPRRIVIDISTFTRETLLILLRFLKDNAIASQRVEFVYAHAKEYSVGDQIPDKWLSKGIREVRSVLGYPGDLLPSRRNHLIVLVGFEDERALSLIRECEPSLISLGLADEVEDGTTPHQATNVHKLDRLKSVLDSVRQFKFKGYDAELTRDAVREEMKAGKGLNTIVAPMNTKISTIGAALLGLEEEAIQICYAQPNLYNFERYSTPDTDFYHFEIQGFPR